MYLYIFFKNKMDRDQIRNLHKINILACLAGPCGGDKRPRVTQRRTVLEEGGEHHRFSVSRVVGTSSSRRTYKGVRGGCLVVESDAARRWSYSQRI
jgi:hypothetical protein